MRSVLVNNRSTAYHLLWQEDGDDTYYILMNRWGQNSGEWIRLSEKSVSWDYLVEKMPELGKYEGDKDGWVWAFEEAGVEVFN